MAQIDDTLKFSKDPLVIADTASLATWGPTEPPDDGGDFTQSTVVT